jgi:hypothetical protein
VFKRLQEHQLFVKHSKCYFSERQVAYIDHVISVARVVIDEHKVQSVLAWPIPASVQVVQAFLGLAGYYRRFIRDFGAIIVPLTKLLCKEFFKWTTKAEDAFRTLQRALTIAPVLYLPALDKEFIIECDASRSGIGLYCIKARASLHSSAGRWLLVTPTWWHMNASLRAWFRSCATGARIYGGVPSLCAQIMLA